MVNKPQIIFASVIGLFLTLVVFLINFPSKPKTNTVTAYKYVRVSEEWAYFEGQKEALNGDVRIKFDKSTGKYQWIKSCWDGGTVPIFNPAISENPNDYR